MPPIRPGRPSEAALRAILERQAGADLTYDEVGATAGDLPTGYRHARESVVLGAGEPVFRAGVEALRRWVPQTRAKGRVVPAEAPIVVGQDILVALGLGPVTAIACGRIVYVTDEPDRFGFAYGTLPVHPERGEEAFHVERDASGTVRFSVVGFSRPADLLTRLGGPIPHWIQRWAIHRYLEGVRRAAAGP